MIEFVKISHKEEGAKYQWLICSMYHYNNGGKLANERIANIFLKSGNVKDYAFNVESLTIENFKKVSKTQCSEILIDFGNESNWGIDRREFHALLDKYYEATEQLGKNNFYIISKDWFNHQSNLLVETSEMVYIYCFIIIHVDTSSNSVALFQWGYD